MPTRFVAIVLSLLLGSCASVRYRDLREGSFKGGLFVMWIDEGSHTAGDGRFLFVPDPSDPLVFTRAGGKGPGAIIQPGFMYTDGGSVPKIAQLFKGFSPWGYAPAYMIHDWVFVARHCLAENPDDELFTGLRDVTLEESAKILGEAIKALVAEKKVQENDLAGSAITLAVSSPFAAKLWKQKGGCGRVDEKHIRAAKAAFRGYPAKAAGKAFGRAAPPLGIRPAQIITRITF